MSRKQQWRLWSVWGGAIVGALLLAFGFVVYTGRPSVRLLLLWCMLLCAVLVANGWMIAQRSKLSIASIGLAMVVFVVVVSSYTSCPLPRGNREVGDLPRASPPVGMSMYALPTGYIHRTAAFGFRGGSILDERDFVMTAVLIRHPRGDLLIDTGFGRAIDTQVKLMPWSFRLMTDYVKLRPAVEQLRAVGYNPQQLHGILLTHAHWDHASGLADFASVPVVVGHAERAFIQSGGWITAVARSAHHQHYQEYTFEDGAYLGFAQSHDVYDDGSIVIVPVPGHTPGSVVIFVTLPENRRYVFVGDLVWQQEGISQRQERPWMTGRLADHNHEQVREGIVLLSAIIQRYPEIVVVPSHDPRGYLSIPVLNEDWSRQLH